MILETNDKIGSLICTSSGACTFFWDHFSDKNSGNTKSDAGSVKFYPNQFSHRQILKVKTGPINITGLCILIPIFKQEKQVTDSCLCSRNWVWTVSWQQRVRESLVLTYTHTLNHTELILKVVNWFFCIQPMSLGNKTEKNKQFLPLFPVPPSSS